MRLHMKAELVADPCAWRDSGAALKPAQSCIATGLAGIAAACFRTLKSLWHAFIGVPMRRLLGQRAD
jgi:hypothetical protein